MRCFVPQTRAGRLVLTCAALTAMTVVTFVLQTVVFAAPYVNPFWTNTSPSPESPVPSVAALAISPEGVDVRTGELIWSHFLFRTPGVLEDNVFGLTWRSMLSGSSQLGNRVIPRWEMTAQYQVLIPGTPNAPFGHQVVIRRRSGRVDTFLWNGTAYTAPPNVFDTLGGNPTVGFNLTDTHGCFYTFDLLGMPATVTKA